MPGIAGIIKKQPYGGVQEDLRRMVESMRHEPNYIDGQHCARELGLYLGWTSHPWSVAQWMPLVSSDGRHILVILGEHFSDGKNLHGANGHGGPDSSARDLLRLYEELGDEFFARLNGWFCGVAIDLNLRKATLFNDRYGMSRLYWHEGSDEFLFASEAKALLRVRPALRTIEPSSLGQYLRSNCVMGEQTLFKGISLLPPASAWAFTGSGGPAKKRYFSFLEWERQPTLEADDFCQRFEETVSRVFPAYLEGGPAVAFSLTAGMDTRTILASVKDDRRTFPCYTFGGPWGETFDIRAGRKLAEISGQPHQVIRINERFLAEFPNYAQKSVYISDGTHDVLGAHDVYFNEMARKIAPIRLTGKFGSEIVRTRRLIPSFDFPRDLLQPAFAPFLDEARSLDQVSKNAHPLSRVAAEEIPWYEYGRVAVEQSKVTLRTPYMDNALVKLMYQAPPALRLSRDLQARYIKSKSHELGALPTDLGRIVYGNRVASKLAYLPLWALFKVEYIYLYATPHWLTWIDRRLERLRPERVLVGRQKFEAYRIWMKTHLAEFIQDTLLNPRAGCTEFFNRKSLARVVSGHLAGTHNYLGEINKMLTVELVYSSLFRE